VQKDQKNISIQFKQEPLKRASYFMGKGAQKGAHKKESLPCVSFYRMKATESKTANYGKERTVFSCQEGEMLTFFYSKEE